MPDLAGYPPVPVVPSPPPARQVAEISSLLDSLDEAAAESGQSLADKRASAHENKLVQARLGIASGLHAALRAKHPPTASHSLARRLGCSSWAAAMELDDETRDAAGSRRAAARRRQDRRARQSAAEAGPAAAGRNRADVAPRGAHDRHPGQLRRAAAAASKSCTTAARGTAATASQQDRQGDELPLASRMLSIVDAFDSMTTDHVYRPARSRERALAELFEFAGSQFDPELVRQFQELFSQDQNLLTEKLARRWLHACRRTAACCRGHGRRIRARRSRPATRPTPSLFEKKLIDNMHDGVVFVDSQATILLWNTGVERLTGVSSAAACGRTFLPSLMDMCNNREQRDRERRLPGGPRDLDGRAMAGRVSIMGRQGRHVAVDLHAIPVRSNDGAMHGATVLLHDVSSETSLEEKCQALHAQVAKDPMTQVANRAEFDRMLNNFVAAHQESNLPCSLIMSRHRSLQVDQRHVRPPGRRRGDHHVRVAAEIDVPLGRPGGPLRRRRIRHAVCRLHERGRGPQGRSNSQSAVRGQASMPWTISRSPPASA